MAALRRRQGVVQGDAPAAQRLAPKRWQPNEVIEALVDAFFVGFQRVVYFDDAVSRRLSPSNERIAPKAATTDIDRAEIGVTLAMTYPGRSRVPWCAKRDVGQRSDPCWAHSVNEAQALSNILGGG